MINVLMNLMKKKSKKLFITYSYRYQERLPNELIKVGNKIIKAYKGLFLSLRVMIVCLKSQKRLRS